MAWQSRGVRTVFLHVGTMKTGTTYLQSRLKEHREALARDGVLSPAGQLNAVRDLFSRRGTLGQRNVGGAWEQLIDKLRTTDCAVGVVSMEFLSTCTPREIEEIAAQFAPAELHVVLTVRDLTRVLAAQWQETIQNKAVWTWPDYSEQIIAHLESDGSPSASASAAALAAAREPNDSAESFERNRTVRRTAAGRFWRQHDVARIVGDWAAVTSPDRIHIVTVASAPVSSPQRPDPLWDRFTEVIGVDARRYPRGRESVRSNTGLDLPAAEFLRRLNARLDADISREAYLRHVKHLLGKSALVDRGSELKPTLTPDQHARAVAYSERLGQQLHDVGVDVVGDLAELVPAPFVAAPAQEAGWLDRKVADAAVDGVLAVLRQLDALEPVIAAATGTAGGTDSADATRRVQRRLARRASRDRAPGS